MKKRRIKPGLSLRKNMTRIVSRMLRDVMASLEVVVAHPAREKDLHRARIAAKPLRYSIEILEDASGPRCKEYFSEIKDLIRLMGKIHDLDSSRAILTGLLKEIGDRAAVDAAASRTKELSPIRKMLAKQKRERARLFGKMAARVGRLKAEAVEKGLLENL